MLYLPLYVAIDGGFFTKEGLDVTKQTAGSPSAALSAVLSGSADFSLHGPEWTAVASEKGADVDVIANVVNGAAVWIATAPDVKFTSIKDVKGEVVVSGQMPTTSTSLFFRALKENGMSPSDVKLVQVPLGSEIGPLVAGQSKIAVMYQALWRIRVLDDYGEAQHRSRFRRAFREGTAKRASLHADQPVRNRRNRP
jgi:NitT/TauT family transport system substrate-binding protein